jgi:hypothetical protein
MAFLIRNKFYLTHLTNGDVSGNLLPTALGTGWSTVRTRYLKFYSVDVNWVISHSQIANTNPDAVVFSSDQRRNAREDTTVPCPEVKI